MNYMKYNETSASRRSLTENECEWITTHHGAGITAIANGAVRISGGNSYLVLSYRLRCARRHVRVGEIFEFDNEAWLRQRGEWLRVA